MFELCKDKIVKALVQQEIEALCEKVRQERKTGPIQATEFCSDCKQRNLQIASCVI